MSGQNPNRGDLYLERRNLKYAYIFKMMNSRRCASQTESVMGKTGKCKVEETPKGGEATSSLVFEDAESSIVEQKRKVAAAAADLGKKSRSASEELMKEEERAMEGSNRKDDWVCEGVVVRVMSENGFYKQKGVVRKVIDRCVGEIEMLESKHVVRVYQKDLKTVLPKIGELVKIVNGAYQGSNARLLGINAEKFCPKVKIENGVYDGRVIQAIDYGDICQVL